jgi:thiol-disulfide isomerase/thioredoxin
VSRTATSSTRIEPRRPTWGEATAEAGKLPPLEGKPAGADKGPIITTMATTGKPKRSPVPGSPKPMVATAPKVASWAEAKCEYDDRHRRIVDFRLPDLKGMAVRFQDLDADLVLLDFWGTWCKPCVKSIPLLVELQQQKGKGLKVIGIACEQGEPQTSAARVAETVKKLGVNYQVLLSKNDGTCPIQEALHVSAFPTMILVDRQGRVLWRDQGATPTTLARLDRMLTNAAADSQARRY